MSPSEGLMIGGNDGRSGSVAPLVAWGIATLHARRRHGQPRPACAMTRQARTKANAANISASIPFPSPVPMRFTVATYNIHKGFSHLTRRMVNHELKDPRHGLAADIRYLQELKAGHRRDSRSYLN